MPKKVLTKKVIENLIQASDQAMTFVEQKKTSCSSEMWQYNHHILVDNHQQPFVCCNTCKELLAFSSMNGTNNLRNHDNLDEINIFFIFAANKI